MTATERLRKLLTERGVEWTYADGTVSFNDGNHWFHAWAYNDGAMCVSMGYLTPEQAIAATLGSGTCEKVYAVGGIIAQAECHDVCASVSEFTCSTCGFNCDLASWISLFDGDDGRHRHHHHGTPNYCPNCGRKVVSE